MNFKPGMLVTFSPNIRLWPSYHEVAQGLRGDTYAANHRMGMIVSIPPVAPYNFQVALVLVNGKLGWTPATNLTVLVT